MQADFCLPRSAECPADCSWHACFFRGETAATEVLNRSLLLPWALRRLIVIEKPGHALTNPDHGSSAEMVATSQQPQEYHAGKMSLLVKLAEGCWQHLMTHPAVVQVCLDLCRLEARAPPVVIHATTGEDRRCTQAEAALAATNDQNT